MDKVKENHNTPQGLSGGGKVDNVKEVEFKESISPSMGRETMWGLSKDYGVGVKDGVNTNSSDDQERKDKFHEVRVNVGSMKGCVLGGDYRESNCYAKSGGRREGRIGCFQVKMTGKCKMMDG